MVYFSAPLRLKQCSPAFRGSPAIQSPPPVGRCKYGAFYASCAPPAMRASIPRQARHIGAISKEEGQVWCILQQQHASGNARRHSTAVLPFTGHFHWGGASLVFLFTAPSISILWFLVQRHHIRFSPKPPQTFFRLVPQKAIFPRISFLIQVPIFFPKMFP